MVTPACPPPRIPIARLELGEPEIAAVRRVIESGWISQGPEAEAFEREFAAFVGAPHAASVSSGTTALHCALLAAGISAGDEVITVSHSFIATANAVRYVGAMPVFVDIEAGGFNIDVDRVTEAIGPRTRAILAVHQVGMPCDLPRLLTLARAHGLLLIEDAACAVGSEILWRGHWTHIGAPIGDAACFSFHPRKVLTTGDGGMVTTPHTDWDSRIRSLRHHGMSVAAHVRHDASRVIVERYVEPGFNFRLTDLQAAIGREQLRRLVGMVSRRRALAARYTAALSNQERLTTPQEPAWARSNWQSYCVGLHPSLDQLSVMQQLLELGIATRRGVMCAHREPAWCGLGTWRCVGPAHRALRRSEEATDHGIVIPLWPSMDDADQDRVVEALRACTR